MTGPMLSAASKRFELSARVSVNMEIMDGEIISKFWPALLPRFTGECNGYA
jgi:hypothetical protein